LEITNASPVEIDLYHEQYGLYDKNRC